VSITASTPATAADPAADPAVVAAHDAVADGERLRPGRRQVLTVAGAGVVTAALASCTPLSPTASLTSATAAGTAGSGAALAPKAVATDPAASAGVAGSGAARSTATLPILRAQSVVAAGAPVPNLLGTDPVWHLLRRATFGPTPALVAEVRAIGAAAWLNQQLNPAAIDDSACDAYLTRYPSLPMTTMQLRAGYPKYSGGPMMELGRATLARALFSKRQLFEVMVEFWSNHFNVTTPSGEAWDVKTVEDREVIRKNALGKFSALLQASAKSAAMGRYLDNASSSTDTLNENYGRELLELHTVGRDAGYTQAEVVDSARLMTGYTIGRHGEFAYYNDWRYLGPVKVLGFTSPNDNDFNGLHVAESYLDYLAHHPATATRLATKLATRFVSDTPPASLVTLLANTYLANDTAIVPVLRALFTSAEFTSSIGQKTKRPLEDVLGAARTVGVTPAPGDATSLGGLYWNINGLGQAPLNWGPPNGFPDVAGAWLSTSGLLGRWNSHMGVIRGWWTDGMTTPAFATLLGGATPADNGALVDVLSNRLLGIRLADAQRTPLVTFLNAGTPRVADSIKWRIDITAALLLDSPNWIQR
jgi:uncharacterized protein (DUF1800 family)